MSQTNLFVATVNDWNPLTIVRKSTLSNVGRFLDSSVELTNFANFLYFLQYVQYDYIYYLFITNTLLNIFYINIWLAELTIFQKHNY